MFCNTVVLRRERRSADARAPAQQTSKANELYRQNGRRRSTSRSIVRPKIRKKQLWTVLFNIIVPKPNIIIISIITIIIISRSRSPPLRYQYGFVRETLVRRPVKVFFLFVKCAPTAPYVPTWVLPTFELKNYYYSAEFVLVKCYVKYKQVKFDRTDSRQYIFFKSTQRFLIWEVFSAHELLRSLNGIC